MKPATQAARWTGKFTPVYVCEDHAIKVVNGARSMNLSVSLISCEETVCDICTDEQNKKEEG